MAKRNQLTSLPFKGLAGRLCSAVAVVGIGRLLQVPPPFTPKVKSEGDFSNFDKFDDEDLKILPKDKYAKEFAEF